MGGMGGMGGFFESVIWAKLFQTQVCTGVSAPAGPASMGYGLRHGLRRGLRHGLRCSAWGLLSY